MNFAKPSRCSHSSTLALLALRNAQKFERQFEVLDATAPRQQHFPQKVGRNCCPAKVYPRAEVYARAPERADAGGSADQTCSWAIRGKPPKAGGSFAQDRKLKDAIAFF